MHTCVVNLGLKSMRAAVFDQTGHRLAIAYRPIESRMGEGRVEQDPEDWWRAALETLDEVLADRSLAQEVGRITTTTSAGCLVALDRDGRVVRNAIMISDVRAASRRLASRRTRPSRRLRLPGGRVTPDLMLPKIVWLRDEEPANHAPDALVRDIQRLPGPSTDRRDGHRRDQCHQVPVWRGRPRRLSGRTALAHSTSTSHAAAGRRRRRRRPAAPGRPARAVRPPRGRAGRALDLRRDLRGLRLRGRGGRRGVRRLGHRHELPRGHRP